MPAGVGLMDQDTLVSAGLVLVFILVGGVFAGTEMALVSLRESQVDRMAKEGGRKARTAQLARDPNRFLSAVQIGVTVAGFFSAAFGASTLAPDVAPLFVSAGLSKGAAETTALIALTLVIAYLSLVLGELVPKRIALQRTEQFATLVAPPLDRFARLMRPAVWTLSRSTDVVVKLLGGDPTARNEEMSEEELRGIVAGHGGLEDMERRILDDVFAAGDRSLSEVMRPRGEVAFMEADLTVAQALDVVADAPYSRYPVIDDSFDDVLGFLHVRDLLAADRELLVRDLTREILLLPSTNRLLPSMSRMRAERVHIAVVVDEYGGTDGIVTLEDMVEELIGDIRDEYDTDEPAFESAVDGVFTVDAGLTIEEFEEQTGITLVDGPYETAAGYVIDRLGRLAEVGDVVHVGDDELRVAEVEARRIKVLEVHLADRE